MNAYNPAPGAEEGRQEMATDDKTREPVSHPQFTWYTEQWGRMAPLEDDIPLDVAQRMYDSGMLWLANRTLHPFGYALGVTVDDDGKVTALNLHYSSDPMGINYDTKLENRGREKFYRGLGIRR